MKTADTPRDYSVLLPPGWARIPLDGREGARVAALAAQRTASLPEPQRYELRDRLSALLRATLRNARACGGIDVLLSPAERDGIALAASCLVSFLDRGAKAPLDMLAAELSADGGDTAMTQIPSGPTVRHRYAEAGVTKVDYFLPVPGRTGLLTLSFGTPVEPIADAFVLLFDAIAASLRWQS
jgi:hypothetical protein